MPLGARTRIVWCLGEDWSVGEPVLSEALWEHGGLNGVFHPAQQMSDVIDDGHGFQIIYFEYPGVKYHESLGMGVDWNAFRFSWDWLTGGIGPCPNEASQRMMVRRSGLRLWGSRTLLLAL